MLVLGILASPRAVSSEIIEPVTYISAGSINYPIGSENSNFTIMLPAEVQAGDWLIVNVTSTVSDISSITAPQGTETLLSLTSDPNSNFSGAVFAIEVASPKPATLTWTWPTAQRGGIAWVAFRNTLGVDVFSDTDWVAAGPTTKQATAISVNDGSYVLAVVMQGSGSQIITPTAGWTERTNLTERDGHIATKGVSSGGLETGASFTVSNSLGHRLLQIGMVSEKTMILLAETISDTYSGFSGDVADGVSIVVEEEVLITTNKSVGGGLYVLDLDGNILSSNLNGAANSVDYRDLTGISGWDNRLLVMTSDRDNNALRLYWMNRTTKALSLAGTINLTYEPYGSCLYLEGVNLYAFVTDRGSSDTGTHYLRQYLLSRSGESVTAGSVLRTINAEGVMEGMCANDLSGYIYVSIEDYGLYRYSAAANGSTTPITIDTVNSGNLVADVEDVSLFQSGENTYLMVSSQGNNSLHVYNADTFEHVKRLKIKRPDGTNVIGSDGLDITLSSLSGWPSGLLVVHDSLATPTSNFVLVDGFGVKNAIQ